MRLMRRVWGQRIPREDVRQAKVHASKMKAHTEYSRLLGVYEDTPRSGHASRAASESNDIAQKERAGQPAEEMSELEELFKDSDLSQDGRRVPRRAGVNLEGYALDTEEDDQPGPRDVEYWTRRRKERQDRREAHLSAIEFWRSQASGEADELVEREEGEDGDGAVDILEHKR